MPTYFGSNAWVAAPRKSASGNPLLYGGPMMGFATPSICNEVHLVAEGLQVGDRAQRPADQALDLDGAALLFSRRGLALRALAGRAR